MQVVHPFDAQADGELSLAMDDYVVVRQVLFPCLILIQLVFWTINLLSFSQNAISVIIILLLFWNWVNSCGSRRIGFMFANYISWFSCYLTSQGWSYWMVWRRMQRQGRMVSLCICWKTGESPSKQDNRTRCFSLIYLQWQVYIAMYVFFFFVFSCAVKSHICTFCKKESGVASQVAGYLV